MWTVASDRRLKTNVSNFEEGLELIQKINPVWFNYNGKAGLPTDERGIGTIAQELQKIAPYMVKNWIYENEEGKKEEYLAVDYGALDFALVNAVQEQQQTIEQQTTVNKELKEKIKNQQIEVDEMKTQMELMMHEINKLKENNK